MQVSKFEPNGQESTYVRTVYRALAIEGGEHVSLEMGRYTSVWSMEEAVGAYSTQASAHLIVRVLLQRESRNRIALDRVIKAMACSYQTIAALSN